MRKAVLSPLLSLLVPGVGQLINRHLLKGGMLVAGMSLLFIAMLGLGLFQFNKAVMAATEAGAQPGDFAAVAAQMRAQGHAWLLALVGVMAALWGYAVFDAWRGGRARDAESEEIL